MEYNNKTLLNFSLIIFLFFINVSFVFAGGGILDESKVDLRGSDSSGMSQTEAFRSNAGIFDHSQGYGGANSIAGIMAVVIKTFLSLLGLIFIILIIYAGYNWMTAGGQEDKVSRAKSTIYRAVIGLIIIVAAYAITYFVFKSLDNIGAVGGGASGPVVTSP